MAIPKRVPPAHNWTCWIWLARFPLVLAVKDTEVTESE